MLLLQASALFIGTFFLTWGIVNVTMHPRLGRKPLPPAPHKPDYAKIRSLEIELGLREPDPKPRVINLTPPMTPLEQAGNRWLEGVREAQAAAAKWQACPVCLRRHEGRCAG